ncbi:MAG TPA: PP2C family serine/threonine-protein phosphatase [Pyrinomonadaceae bacterium]|nr:PP2C family serine/threonine-protein phosphatase [Pyrinomonadaceae bacterium]
MTARSTDVPITVASVSDRGLNEKRPLNEDAFLADDRRRIFAVADGVGGAEAGEVASQTAIEVLDEAFRHQRDGDDVEDLMEIAIQRANTSIHTMSREHPRLSMMATTIVALHLDGRRATIGHVGDSRLYRLSPDGRIHRETADHSVVEEEVRAGRMTPQQAANHPSRNVISRALGAESAVEVDTKIIEEVEDGTVFLLCSDGITRHLPDDELSAVLTSTPGLDAACEEMKRRCYERGAEDNLTAVVVRVGEPASRPQAARVEEDWDEQQTLVTQRFSAPASAAHASAAPATQSSAQTSAAPAAHLRRPFDDMRAASVASAPPQPLVEHEALPGGFDDSEAPSYSSARAAQHAPAPPRSASGGVLRALGLLALVAAVAAAAFWGGTFYQNRFGATAQRNNTAAPANAATMTTASTVGRDSAAARDERLREVDRSPSAQVESLAQQMNGLPLTSRNCEYLYLYGRALLLSGRPREAVEAFDAVVARADEDTTPENGQLKIEARLAKVAALMRAGDAEGARAAARELDDVTRTDAGGASGTVQTPASSPLQ